MVIERASGTTSLIDVLDRALDQGHRDRRLGPSLPRRHRPLPRRGAVELSPELYQTLMRRFTLPWRRARRVRTA